MGFIRNFDYVLHIGPTILTRLLAQATAANLNSNLVQRDAEQDAQEEISEILRTNFDITTAFNDTLVWDPTATYNANQLVELNFPAWSATSYVVGNLVSYSDGNAYLCIITAGNTDLPGTSNKWILLGQQNALYYIPYPYPLFQLESGAYNIGSKVFWNGGNYIAQIASSIADQITRLNAVKIGNVPYPNIFPDNSVQGVQAWGNAVIYSISGIAIPSYNYWVNITTYSAGTVVWYLGQVWKSLTNGNTGNIPGADNINWVQFPLSVLIPLFKYPAYVGTETYYTGQIVNLNNQNWQCLTNLINGISPGADIVNWQPVGWTPGDNRARMLVKYMVDIALYHLHSAIAPQNIPDLRVTRYNKAIEWISTVRNIATNIPRLQPDQGGPIFFGGNTKRNNTW